jgi:hypothetical protein
VGATLDKLSVPWCSLVLLASPQWSFLIFLIAFVTTVDLNPAEKLEKSLQLPVSRPARKLADFVRLFAS